MYKTSSNFTKIIKKKLASRVLNSLLFNLFSWYIKMSTRLPLSIRLAVLLIILSEHTLTFMVPTYITYMMERFLEGNTPEEELKSQISYHAGTIEGINRLMMFFSCFFWGAISDKIGRKYCLILVLTGLIVSSVGFGLAPNFSIALM